MKSKILLWLHSRVETVFLTGSKIENILLADQYLAIPFSRVLERIELYITSMTLNLIQ